MMYHVIPEDSQGRFLAADKETRKRDAIKLAKSLAKELGMTVYVFPGDNDEADTSVDYIFKAK